MSKLLERITTDPEICHGKPCIRGMRYPVEFLLELMNSGMTYAEILNDYDDLETEDLTASLEFAIVRPIEVVLTSENGVGQHSCI